MDLTSKKCVVCEIGTPTIPKKEAEKLHQEIPIWALFDDHIEREFKFEDFKAALAFVNKVGEIAEAEGHHPDIYIFYNKVKLTLFTHAAKGLTENDFITAAKIDQI